MDSNKHYFYISGFIAFSLFILFLLLFIFTLFKPNKINTYALKKESYISISLEVVEVKSVQKKKSQKAVLMEEKSTVSQTPKDINKLFSDVWTKKIVHKKEKVKKVDNKRYLELQKKIKIREKNKVKSLSHKINNLENIKTNNKKNASSAAEEVNEYLAKIQAIVYQHFHVPPNTEGKSVKTLIELNSFGKVIDFRVLNYSQNSALNDEADRMKSRLLHINFPENPEHTSSRTVVLLISEE